MDRIILCFDLNNRQTDFSRFMQVVEAFETENHTDKLNIADISKKISIKYCWIKENVPDRYSSLEIVQNIERQWNDSQPTRSIWKAHRLTELGSMAAKRDDYQISYYVRIKSTSDEDIKNIQYFLLVIQQFPLIRGRIRVFIEPFENYLSSGKEKWKNVSVYHKYSHFMRFVLKCYQKIFFSAFFLTEEETVNIQQLSSKKAGIQSTFFPLIEIDSDMYAALNRYCVLDSGGMLAEHGNGSVNSRLEDLLEISKNILEGRLRAHKSKKEIALVIYEKLSREKITALEYAVFSVIVPVSPKLSETQIDYYRKRAGSISSGLIQIIENIFVHSYNHKGVFTFRIIKNGKAYLNKIFENDVDADLDGVLEIDIGDANIYETILDNFSRKLENRDKYFSDIRLSVSHFFQKYQGDREKSAWKKYREENPVRCLGLARLAKELRLCQAVLRMRSSTRYKEDDKALSYQENNFGHGEMNCSISEEFIPGAYFQILFPIVHDEAEKRHNANIFLNGIGNFAEKDEYYAEFIEYGIEALNSQKIPELDRCFYQNAVRDQGENNGKNQMVGMWKKELDTWNSRINSEEKKVYYLDLGGITDIGSPWGVEAFCKGIVNSDIFYSGKVKYIAMINCNNGFIEMMFDTIMMSGKNLNSSLQIYLHADNGLDDMVISGSSPQEIAINARQYCYLKEKPLTFIEKYIESTAQGSFVPEKPQALFPFDVMLYQAGQNELTIFEQYIENIAQRSLTATDEAGYWLSDAHMRLGNKVHLKEFYEISILFRKPRIARKIALLLIRRMVKEGITLLDNYLFYGYASYSREILTAMSEIVKISQEHRGHYDRFAGFAVYQNDIMVQKTLTHISTKVKMYFNKDIPDNVEPKIIQIVPIISTLTTFKKMWDTFRENYQEKVGTNQPVKNYTLFWVRDLQENGRTQWPTEIESEYWEKIEENRTIQTSLIKPGPQFFCCKKIKWYNPLKCEQCYPKNVLDEYALVETDVTSTVPSQQLEVTVPSRTTGEYSRERIINEIRVVNLKDCIFYGHLYRDGNHFQYYVDTTRYFHEQKASIAQWLHNLQEGTGAGEEQNVLNIIVSPQHHTNVEFGHYVSNYYFNGNADVIVIDSTKEYRSNIIAKYADVKAAISNARQMQTTVRFAYVDDTIITGSTYRRVNNLLHSLVPKEIQKPIQFDHVFVLVNRMSFHSKMDYVDDVEKYFHSYVDINVSSVRNYGDSCAMCTLQKNSSLFFKRSSTKGLSEYWDKKQHDYKEVAFDKYSQTADCRKRKEQGYLRLLCSHYAKEHLTVDRDYEALIENRDYGSCILRIVNLMCGVIETGKRDVEAEKALAAEVNAAYFESERLSPIYCCVLGKNPLEALKAYLKVLCRPFFSYGKVYRQAILDLFLLVSESFLTEGFDESLLDIGCEISSEKKYLNDVKLRKKIAELCRYFKENIAQSEDRIAFIQKYLLEGLTDLRSNYIIRKTTIDKYRTLFPRSTGYYRYYFEIEKMIHRLINSNADETKSLWMEYLLITGKENDTSMDRLNEIEICDINSDDDFHVFWKSLIIENTRLYYDSMLCFVRKASDLIQNKRMDEKSAIRQSVQDMWGDYYIKNLRRFVRLEILAESGAKAGNEIEKEIRDRVEKTADLLYLLKKGGSNGIERYEELKKRILDLLYEGDTLKILTSAFAGAQNGDELYAVTEYKSKNVSPAVAARVKEAVKNDILQNKSYYMGQNYIVLCINNNEAYLRRGKIEGIKAVKIQPLYFYIECNTQNHLLAIFRIRKILMYRHQLLHWIEADFNNNLMPILAEKMGVNRQLMRERAGDHNTNTDILTIEKLLQSEYKEGYGEIYQFLLLKVYVNMRIARLFRSEWSESESWKEAYTLGKNEDKMNKAMKNMGSSFFGETLIGLSPRQYLAAVEDIFLFDVEVFGESLKNVRIRDLEGVFRKLNGRCENNYYYKQEYIICIVFDILFTSVKFCCNWEIEIDKFFRKQEQGSIDGIYEDNETLAQYYILRHQSEKCRITVKTEDIPQKNVAYLVFRNKVNGVSRDRLIQLNREFREKMEVKETAGMSLQAMKWYTESIEEGKRIKAQFSYEWNAERENVEFVIKLPILSKGEILNEE